MTAAEREALRAGLPADPNAERALVSEILRGRALPEAARGLSAEHLTVRRYADVFRASVALDRAGEPVDLMGLADRLGAAGLNAIGGLAFLSALLDPLEYAGDVDRIVGRLEQCATRRQYVVLADKLARQATRGPVEPELLAEIARVASSAPSVTKTRLFRIEDIPSVWKCDASTNWLIDGLVPEAAVTLLCGDSGVGKSTLALALAAAVAHGQPFLGRATIQRPVLYVDRENPLAAVRERIERLGINETAALTVWGLWIKPMPDGPTAASILQFASAHRPLIVFDSLVGFHPGSEQDASETRRHMQAYIALAAAGAGVILLHHTGKADTAKQYRGSSDIKAAVDLAYVLESLSEPDAGIRSLRLKAFKNRLTLPETLCIAYMDGRFDLSTGRAETNREILERIISEHPGASKADIENLASAAGIAQRRTRALLEEGVRAGWVRVEPGPRGRQSYHQTEVEIGFL